MIEFSNVSKSYDGRTVLKNLDFTIGDGQFVVLIGPSGCGKTTTLKTINRLLEVDSGAILIDGQDIREVNKVDLRRRIGYVIQQIGLFPNMTVAQNICVVPKLLKWDAGRCRQIVGDLLKLVGMEEYADKYPSELSGGQQQRIGVLRALAASPPIVLMDEPFGALEAEQDHQFRYPRYGRGSEAGGHDHFHGRRGSGADGFAGGDAGASCHGAGTGFPGKTHSGHGVFYGGDLHAHQYSDCEEE